MTIPLKKLAYLGEGVLIGCACAEVGGDAHRLEGGPHGGALPGRAAARQGEVFS